MLEKECGEFVYLKQQIQQAERRMKRSNRRRLSRKKSKNRFIARIIFKEIAKKDPTFFIRLNEMRIAFRR